MHRPHLIYYNDGHHFHGKRVEPPVSIDKLRQPVNELLGTGADLLVLGLGYGDVYFHGQQGGRVVGEAKEAGESYNRLAHHRNGCTVAKETRARSGREVIEQGEYRS